MLEERNIRIEDNQGNSYFPHTRAKTTFLENGKSVESQLADITNESVSTRTGLGVFLRSLRALYDANIPTQPGLYYLKDSALNIPNKTFDGALCIIPFSETCSYQIALDWKKNIMYTRTGNYSGFSEWIEVTNSTMIAKLEEKIKNFIPTKTSELTNDAGFIKYVPDSPVASVNGKTGNVVLNASDVGAETSEGATRKANTAESSANSYTDNKIKGTDKKIDSHMIDNDKHITSAERKLWNNKSSFNGNYNNLYNKPNIPTKTSELTNDAGFIKCVPDSPVASVNGKTGNVILNASDVGAETFEGATRKANSAESNANLYTENKIKEVNNKITDSDEKIKKAQVTANRAIPYTGGELAGILTAKSNTSYTVRQVHNIVLSSSDADLGQMQNGDIWIKYE